MSKDSDLAVKTSRFSEVLEAKIEARKGAFEVPHPFLRTALRGLVGYLNEELVPMGFVMSTELYINDVSRNKNGYTGEPMPRDVTGLPADIAGGMIRMTVGSLVREAYGDEFADAVKEVYRQLATPPNPIQ